VAKNLEKKPGQVVVDGGFTNRDNIEHTITRSET
jgi:hypothetical protein